MEDQTHHFIPRRRYRGEKGWEWRMCRERIPVTGGGDYTLGSNLRYL